MAPPSCRRFCDAREYFVEAVRIFPSGQSVRYPVSQRGNIVAVPAKFLQLLRQLRSEKIEILLLHRLFDYLQGYGHFLLHGIPASKQEEKEDVDQPDKKAEQSAEEINVFELLLHDSEQQSFHLENVQRVDFLHHHPPDIECFH